jgi:hypothetical protein
LSYVAEQQEKDEQEGTRQRTQSNLKLLQQENESVVIVFLLHAEKKDLIWIGQEEVTLS